VREPFGARGGYHELSEPARAQFIAAAKNGKHIIVEKPLAIEWSEISR
jgi:hypothetical protein